MPDDSGLKPAVPERELLALVLMGGYDLFKRIEQTPQDGEVDFSSAGLELLDDVLAIELEHLGACSQRKAPAQIRKCLGLLMSL